jgi:hypothetical protein
MKTVWIFLLLLSLFLFSACAPQTTTPTPPEEEPPTQTPTPEVVPGLVIYDDKLAEGWEDYSYKATNDFSNTAQVHSGSKALALTYTGPYGAFSPFIARALDGSKYKSLTFWAYGAPGGTELFIFTQDSADGDGSEKVSRSVKAGSWQEIKVPMSELGNPASIARLSIQNATEQAQAVFYIDDVQLDLK